MQNKKIVLAYSGGLDTTVMIKWLNEKYGYSVITVTVDLGQKEDFKSIEERAYKAGSIKHYNIDAKEEFVNNFISKAIKANGLYEGKYPLSTALGRPLIVEKLVKVAEDEDAFAVAHGCTGKGNDQVRFEVTVKALNPKLKVYAPVREWNLNRDEEVKYANAHGIEVQAKAKKYSIDQNLWGRSIEGGPLEDPWNGVGEDVFEWLVPPEKAPDKPTFLEIGFSNGLPISLNGEKISLSELISRLNSIAGGCGVGLIDHIEDRLVGIKSREVYECPAAVTLLEAHKALEKMVLTRHELFFKELVDSEWSKLVYFGLWTEPLREDLEGFIESTQSRVEGTVRVKLYKGNLLIDGLKSPYSLYDRNLSTYGIESTFDQKMSEGFIEIWGLQSRTGYEILKRVKGNG
ncbi:MAG: argininosuccinate synthase [Nitrososphaeria archaeon]